MRVFYIILFIFFFDSPSAGEIQSRLNYTFTKDEITHAGLVRLSDIFFLIDEFQYYSIDGFTWPTTLNEFDQNQQQNWILMVNGQTIQTKVFDTVHINLLPFSTDHIDSIEVFIYPELVNAEFSDKGIIHIHTRKIERGLTLQGQFTAGNRTGDPGPYRYIEFWSENIDRIAADESYWLAYADTNVYLGIGHYVQMYYPTDPRMADRLRDIYTESNPYIKSRSFSFRAGLPELFSRPHLEIFQTTLEDLYFFKPVGREIPVNRVFSFLGLSGRADFSTGAQLKYRLFYQNHHLDKRQNRYQYDFDWGTEELGGDIQSNLYIANGQGNLGAGYKQIRAITGYILSRESLNIGKLYGSYQYKGLKFHKPGFDVLFEFGDAGKALKLSGSDQWKISDISALTGVLSYSEAITLRENTLWYWTEQGYNFISDIDGFYEIEGTLSPSSQGTFDLTWQRVEDQWPAFEGGFSFRRFWAKNWEIQDLNYDRQSKTVSGPVIIKTNMSGGRGRIFIKLDYNHLKSVSHHLFYHYSTSFGPYSFGCELWKTIPAHCLIYRIRYKPVESFSIWSMLKYQSPVFWNDYKNVDEQSKGKYSAHLSEVMSLDLAVNKWLWKKQIKVDVVFRNIFNRKNIYFPIGASFDLRFYAQAEIYFNFM